MFRFLMQALRWPGRAYPGDLSAAGWIGRAARPAYPGTDQPGQADERQPRAVAELRVALA
jgi:hypothetical protein